MRNKHARFLLVRFQRHYPAGLAFCALLCLNNCPPPPPPPTTTLTEFQPSIDRGGRTVAVSAQAGTQSVIAASESGGLFKSSDGGQTWAHIDSLPAFRMSDVAFAQQFTPQIVVATSTDANPNAQGNLGGVWASSDAGGTWTHIVLPGPCSPGPTNAFGVAYVPPNDVFIATDCGLVRNPSVGSANWTQPSNWQLLRPGSGLMAVSAQVDHAGPIVIDVCLQGGGADRSPDSGRTWRGVVSGPECQSARSIAQAPLDVNIVFATSHTVDPGGGDIRESDDGGLTWPVVKSGSFTGRPLYVTTNFPVDQVSSHFDVYWAGQMATCSFTGPTPHCPTDPAKWSMLPNSSLNHDINGVAVNPIPFTNNCAIFMAADFGVYKTGPPSTGQPCGIPSAWSIAGNAASGYGALQMYDMTGQVQFPITGGGINISGHTSLFFGSMDNGLWATYDAGASPWQAFGASGFRDPEGSFLQLAPTPQISTEVTFDSLDTSAMEKSNLDQTTGAISDETPWNNVSPPGNSSPPLFIAANTYVQWFGTTLFVTVNNGTSWNAAGVLPPGFSLLNGPQSGLQMAQTVVGAGPVVYTVVADSSGRQGIAMLAHFLPPPASAVPFEVRTVGGTNDRGLPSGLQSVWGYCFGFEAWYCTPAFGVDPNDHRHMYAADSQQRIVAFSVDAGETWKEDIGLTNLVTGNGVSISDSLGQSQVHVIAFDPGNSQHILVGTDQGGIIASANGGVTWRALPNTAPATAITSIFFDDRTNTIFVSTYGRGLWKLSVDWTTVH